MTISNPSIRKIRNFGNFNYTLKQRKRFKRFCILQKDYTKTNQLLYYTVLSDIKLFVFIYVYEFLYLFLLLVSTKSLLCFVFRLILNVLTSFHRILMIANKLYLIIKTKRYFIITRTHLLLPSPSPDILKGILYVFAVLTLTRGRNCWFHEKCNQSEAIKT
jgi:hypothetical protein